MYKIKTTNEFEKDCKKMQKRGKDLIKLQLVIKFLVEGKLLPEKYKNHKDIIVIIRSGRKGPLTNSGTMRAHSILKYCE